MCFKSPNACSKIRRDSQSTKQFAYQGKDIVFRFIIEYSSLRDFDPNVIGLFLNEDFGKMVFWFVSKLEISYRVIIS
jgi:hypothetical protein